MAPEGDTRLARHWRAAFVVSTAVFLSLALAVWIGGTTR